MTGGGDYVARPLSRFASVGEMLKPLEPMPPQPAPTRPVRGWGRGQWEARARRAEAELAGVKAERDGLERKRDEALSALRAADQATGMWMDRADDRGRQAEMHRAQRDSARGIAVALEQELTEMRRVLADFVEHCEMWPGGHDSAVYVSEDRWYALCRVAAGAQSTEAGT